MTALLLMLIDRVFSESESTTDIFQELISPIIQSGMRGINGEYVQNVEIYTICTETGLYFFISDVTCDVLNDIKKFLLHSMP